MIIRIFGFVTVMASLGVVYRFETSAAADGFRLLHWPAMILTGIGPIGLVLVCSDWAAIRQCLRLLWGPSPTQRQRLHETEAQLLTKAGADFYAQGSRALESLRQQPLTAAFHRAMERLLLRIPTADVRDLVDRDRARDEARLTQAIQLVTLGVRLSPSIGMLGTILGMVRLLATLEDPSHIGSHMSLALMTTFYGLFFSLVLWTPLQQKLERLFDVEAGAYDQLAHWLELLEARKPSQYFADVLAEPSLPSTLASPTPTAPELR